MYGMILGIGRKTYYLMIELTRYGTAVVSDEYMY